MTYHRVDSKFWTDPKSSRWDDDTRLLALYMKTGPHATLEGFYRLPKAYILADLNWSIERLAEPFAKLLSEGFISYDETVSVILIRNALKYQSPDNGNQVISAVRKVAELPETPLLYDFQGLAERFSKRLAQGLAERFGKQRTPTPLPIPAPEKKDAHTRKGEPEEAIDPKVQEAMTRFADNLGLDPSTIAEAQDATARDRRRK